MVEIVPEAWDRRPCVYRAFAADGELLYVGKTITGPRRRLLKHRAAGAEWIPLTATVELEWFDTEEEALTAEAHAVSYEAPRFNRTFQLKH